jgi:hypothetical protein
VCGVLPLQVFSTRYEFVSREQEAALLHDITLQVCTMHCLSAAVWRSSIKECRRSITPNQPLSNQPLFVVIRHVSECCCDRVYIPWYHAVLLRSALMCTCGCMKV